MFLLQLIRVLIVLSCDGHREALGYTFPAARVHDSCPVNQVYVHTGGNGADRLQAKVSGQVWSFIYRPVTATLRQAFEDLGASVGVYDDLDVGIDWQYHDLLADILTCVGRDGVTPLLISMGLWWYTDASTQFLKDAAAGGAYLVMYNSEFIDVTWFPDVTGFGASEIWDFTTANLKNMAGRTKLIHRFVPPGYSKYLDYNVDLSNTSWDQHSVGFLGNLVYRDGSFMQYVQSLLTPNNMTLVPPGPAGVWTAEDLKAWASQYPVQINLHKSAASGGNNFLDSQRGLESFRLSLLLSNKVCLVSQHGYHKDEKRFAGMVHFVDPVNFTTAFVNLDVPHCRSESYYAFKERHSPRRLVRDSGFLDIWPFVRNMKGIITVNDSAVVEKDAVTLPVVCQIMQSIKGVQFLGCVVGVAFLLLISAASFRGTRAISAPVAMKDVMTRFESLYEIKDTVQDEAVLLTA